MCMGVCVCVCWNDLQAGRRAVTTEAEFKQCWNVMLRKWPAIADYMTKIWYPCLLRWSRYGRRHHKVGLLYIYVHVAGAWTMSCCV